VPAAARPPIPTDIRRVQEWIGHADAQTTTKCLHYAPGDDAAALVEEAFRAVPAGLPNASS
jgi:hypothetical protein